MGDRTVSKIVDAVSTAILDTIQRLYLPQPTTEMWETIARRFEERWQIPHCIGGLDGKQFMIRSQQKVIVSQGTEGIVDRSLVGCWLWLSEDRRPVREEGTRLLGCFTQQG